MIRVMVTTIFDERPPTYSRYFIGDLSDDIEAVNVMNQLFKIGYEG